MGTVGRPGSGRVILAWGFAAVAAGGLAFALGALGVFIPPAAVTAEAPAEIDIIGSVPSGVPGYDCPGGLQLATFPSSTRVHVTGRTPDGSWLLTRSPAAGFEPVWVRADQVSVDEFPTTVAGLDEVTCDPLWIGIGGGG